MVKLYTELWTDASVRIIKNKILGGIGIYGHIFKDPNIQRIQISSKIYNPVICSLSAELFAITYALRLIHTINPCSNGIIYTDSMHSIKLIRSNCLSSNNWCVKRHPDIIIPVRLLYRSLNIEIKYVKAHNGVYGNEMADKLAKKATKNQ